MSRYVSNRPAAEDHVGILIQRHLEEEAARFERILDAEFTSPKSGILIGKTSRLRQYARQVISGKGYREGKTPSRRGIKQRSAPGEAPAVQTAALRKGVSHRVERLGAKDWSVVIGVTMQSGRGSPQGKTGRSIANDLELGTSTMAPRPAWRMALAKWKEQYSGAR